MSKSFRSACTFRPLTFDLFFDSKPIIVETGISTYERGLERNYQRSSSAHNTLQLGKNLRNGKTKWIEPIDTWHAFRAAKKADCNNRKYENFNDLLIVNGGHNAFEKNRNYLSKVFINKT